MQAENNGLKRVGSHCGVTSHWIASSFPPPPDPGDRMIKSASYPEIRPLQSSLGLFIWISAICPPWLSSPVKVISDTAIEIVTLRLIDETRSKRRIVECLDRPRLFAHFRPRPGLMDRIYRALVASNLQVRQVRVWLAGADEATKVAAGQLNSEQVVDVAVARPRATQLAFKSCRSIFAAK